MKMKFAKSETRKRKERQKCMLLYSNWNGCYWNTCLNIFRQIYFVYKYISSVCFVFCNFTIFSKWFVLSILSTIMAQFAPTANVCQNIVESNLYASAIGLLLKCNLHTLVGLKVCTYIIIYLSGPEWQVFNALDQLWSIATGQKLGAPLFLQNGYII